MLASVRFRLKTRDLITLLLLSTVLLIQITQSVPLSSQSLLKSPDSMNPSGSMAEDATVTSTSTPNQSIPASWPSWRAHIASIPASQAGCFTARYPSTVWQQTQCVTAPTIPLLPAPATVGGASSAQVGNGNDEVAHAPSGKLIGSSIGSFQTSGLTSETDNMYGANNYGLQVNSQTFPTSTTYTGSKSTTGWEQFVWINWTPTNTVGYGYIQYWLLGYQSRYGSCPSSGPPSGSSWMKYSTTDCYANSPGFITPLEPATNLASLSLEGFSNYNGVGNDVDMVCISGWGCNSVSITDQVVNLYLNWQYSEFNVFGVGSGSEANFNSGTTITVANALTDQSGNVIVPSCVNTGYTGETNNLNLDSCSSNNSGLIVFIESTTPGLQILVTDVDAGSGSVSPSCPSPFGCAESVGSAVSVTATASSDWQFSSWSINGASCSGGSSISPCAFNMPNNPVTNSAIFAAQVMFGSGLISWGSCANPPENNGAIIFSPLGLIPACYVPTGYSISSWTCSGGLSCSGSSNVVLVSISGPGTIALSFKPGSLSSPLSTMLTASSAPSNPSPGSSFTVSGALTANGGGVSGETVVLVFGWSPNVVTTLTESEGSYSYIATAPATPSPYKVDVFFLGDYSGSPQYLPSKATALQPLPLPNPVSTMLTVSAEPSNPTHGSSFTVSGELTAIGGGVGGETIVLVFGWSSSIVTVKTESTGSIGTYSYTATAPPSAGSYNVDAFFLGDYSGTTQYLPSKATAMITVN